jgi:glycosyltransferase involved in cell wall biosynthesis
VEELLLRFTTYDRVILIVLIFTLIVQFIYYLFIYTRVQLLDPARKKVTHSKEPVSIIICARNESENLTNHLPLILEQDYPNYEVLVVNDCSDDDSQDILEKFQEKYPHLRTTVIKHDEKFTHGKKLALTLGIKGAKNEWLLFTDADCQPAGKQWLSTMQRNFTDANSLVIAYGGYNKEKGFLNKLIRFDAFFIALQYLSFALIKVPYMGVGRNLAYRKSVFIKNKGFASHAHLQSGDDDLVSNAQNTTVEFEAEAHTYSIPKKKFRYWTNQKRRHFSTSSLYKFKHKFLLGLEIFSRLLFYACIILLVINPATWIIGVAAYILRLIIQLFVFNGAMNRLKEKKLLLFSILFDIILPLISIFLYLVQTSNSKHYRWK